MKAYIYKKLLIPTGRYYIGKHNGNNKYYNGSGTDWLIDLKKYSLKYKECIKTEILEYVKNEQDLNAREEYWLNYYDAANNPIFYNKSNKSSGCSTELSRQILSQKLKSHPSLTGNKVRNKKISKSLMGNLSRNEKISESLKNKPKSELHILHMKKPKPLGFNDSLKKKIVQTDKDGNIINKFESLTEASKITGFNLQALNNCALGKTKSSFGYKWYYEN
jgi:hypothetical protein